jgi:RNA polymerase II subunit A small phosphatase-like protein
MNLKSSSYNSSYSNLKDAIMGPTNSTNLAKKYDIEYSYRQPYRNDFKSYNFIHSNNSNINITEMPKTSVNFYSNKIQNYRNIGLNNDKVFSGIMENKRGISENKSTHGFNENLSSIKNYSYNLSSLSSNNLNSPKSNTKNLFASDLIYQEVEGVNKVRPISSSIAINDSRQYSYSSNNKYHSSNNSRLLSPNTNLNKKTLILDLDETLVHSSFKPFIFKSDIILNVDLDRKIHTIHVLKRPGVHEFLERMSKVYEVVIFTASLSPYANPLIDQLDKQRHASCRLFREHCTHVNGMYVKDMKRLGRDLKDIIIIDVR